MTEFDLRRRERFKLGVFAVLGAFAILLIVQLIHQAQQAPGPTSKDWLSGYDSTNDASVTIDP